MKLSPLASRIIGPFSVIVMIAATLAMKFAHHPIVWLIVLTTSIPLVAAVVGGLPQRSEGDKD